jgi:hypothetical protein
VVGSGPVAVGNILKNSRQVSNFRAQEGPEPAEAKRHTQNFLNLYINDSAKHVALLVCLSRLNNIILATKTKKHVCNSSYSEVGRNGVKDWSIHKLL